MKEIEKIERGLDEKTVAGREVINQLNEEAWLVRRTDVKASFRIAEETEGLSRIANYEKGYAEALRTQGYCYWRFSDYEASMKKSLEAIEIFKKLKDKKGEADTLNNVGAVYMFMDEHENRLQCNLTCLNIRAEIGDLEGVAGSLNNIGETYLQMGDYDNAELYFRKCLEHPSSGDQVKSWAWHNLGMVSFKKKNLDEAILLLNKSISITENIHYQVLHTASLSLLGEIYIRKNDAVNAVAYLEKALKEAEENNLKEEIYRIYKSLSKAFEFKGDLVEALNFFKKYHTTKEDLFNENNTQKIKDIQFQYQIEAMRKQGEIERLKNIELQKANEEIEKQHNKITEQKHIVDQKNKDILDSIKYAKRIQEAILPPDNLVEKLLPESFILYKPKDIVSGDFYFITPLPSNLEDEQSESDVLFAVVDCTGHGVPGAFMSIVGHNGLIRAINEHNLKRPSDILDYLNVTVNETLRQKHDENSIRDGMDIALCTLSYSQGGNLSLQFAGANIPVLLIRNNEIIQIKGDKHPVGSFVGEGLKPFTHVELNLRKDDTIYLLSDGYSDQFGGEKGKKFKYAKLKELLLSIHNQPLQKQKVILNDTFEAWKGNLEQLDDVCIIGVRI